MMPITLTLPEPPSLNEMIHLAKQRTRISKRGTWMKQARPVVYDQAKTDYETLCLAAVRRDGNALPRVPFPRWTLDAVHFRLHTLRDPIELLAGLKWPVDALVSMGLVANDSPRHLAAVPLPTQEISRRDRGVTLTLTLLTAPEAQG